MSFINYNLHSYSDNISWLFAIFDHVSLPFGPLQQWPNINPRLTKKKKKKKVGGGLSHVKKKKKKKKTFLLVWSYNLLCMFKMSLSSLISQKNPVKFRSFLTFLAKFSFLCLAYVLLKISYSDVTPCFMTSLWRLIRWMFVLIMIYMKRGDVCLCKKTTTRLH